MKVLMNEGRGDTEYRNKIIQGDALIILKELSSDSIDAIVTDPPYGLSFMGKKWDYNVPNIAIWKECLRVLKPGGHLLSFAGTRTYHRMVVNIEDAGFEIRDMIAWVYGSGFPKSRDVGKAIDKIAGIERECIGTKRACFGGHGRSDFDVFHSGLTNKINEKVNITIPSTYLAKQWDGWGTGLKPAMEPITIARKPLSEKTIAENVLKYETGGLNIDKCRIEMSENDFQQYKEKRESFDGTIGQSMFSDNVYSKSKTKINNRIETKGRWPANFIHDNSEEVIGLFPETKTNDKKKQTTIGIWSKEKINHQQIENYTGGDQGSAARYFYCAKASKQDRGKNNKHPTVKPTDLMRYLCRLVTPPKGIILDPFMGSGSTGKAAVLEGFRFIGIELDPHYFKIAEKRIKEEAGLFIWK